MLSLLDPPPHLLLCLSTHVLLVERVTSALIIIITHQSNSVAVHNSIAGLEPWHPLPRLYSPIQTPRPLSHHPKA